MAPMAVSPPPPSKASLLALTETYADHISFYLNGTPVSVPNPPPTITLLTYLREIGLTGTKLGCAEGGCGACTVVVSQFNPTTKKIYHASVNACLAPLVSVDGKHVITVEGIGSSSNPHPVQERIALGNGSQCGFCTPGIVMSMYALLRNCKDPVLGPSEEEVEEAFDGNLCRCTGYRPILDAVQTFSHRELLSGIKNGTSKMNGVSGCSKSTSNGGSGCCMENGTGGSLSNGGCCKTQTKEDPPVQTNFVPPKFKKYAPDTELIFPPKLTAHTFRPLAFGNKTKLWLRPVTLEQLLQIKAAYPPAKLIGGSSETQIEVKFKDADYNVSVYVGDIAELRQFAFHDDCVEIGGNITLTDLEMVAHQAIEKYGPIRAQSFSVILKQLRYFAGRQIRNVGTPAGNLATASPISDLNPVFLALEATIVAKSASATTELPLSEFFTGYRQTTLPQDSVIASIRVPLARERGEYIRAYKQAKRKDDDIAIVTACFRVLMSEEGVVEKATLAYGGMAPLTKIVKSVAEFLPGKVWAESSTVEGVLNCIEREFNLPYNVPGGMATYRKSLALGFFYRFYHDVLSELNKSAEQSGTSDPSEPPSLSTLDSNSVPEIEREISSGIKDIAAADAYAQKTLGSIKPHVSALKQCTGEAQYTDDLPHLKNELFGCLVLSTKAHAHILSVDTSAALALPGVHHWIDHHDLPDPTANYWGIIKDEPFFAVDKVYTAGQPIGMILADTAELAEKASRKVRIEYEELPAIFTIEEAIEQNSFFEFDRYIKRGEPEDVWGTADHVFEGVARLGGQEHFYLETNACMVIPKPEDGELEVIASTQNPTEVQAYAARVTGVAYNKVVAKVKRLGGGFGGKETRSVQLAAICAVGAKVSKRPVRAMLNRDEDILTSGQRHPFLGKWKVAIDKNGKFLALDADIYGNAGWSYDLSAGVVERALGHVDNVYNFPVVHVRGHVAKTNTVSNTAFRGFGAPQGMFITETFLSEIADQMDMPPERLREINMYKPGDVTHFNQDIQDWHVPLMYDQIVAESDYWARKEKVKEFNRGSKWRKRGMAIIPTKFGISFTAVHMNQAGALVHIYQDGSVLLAHGGTEMGQGLHTKMIMIAAEALQVPPESVFISETATNTVINASPTAASASSDLNGYAIHNACEVLNERLAPYRKKFGPKASMKEMARAAYFDRVNMSANGFYRTPDIGYVWGENRGQMSYYFTQGVAVAEVEVDTLTGDWTCLRADVKMDVGRSINPAIDYGQIEGAFIQGLGLFTMEESLWHRASGQIATRGPGTYKIPGFRDVPQKFNVSLLKDVEWENLRTIQRSRGVGEPPLFLGASVFFAIRDALKSAREEWEEKPEVVRLRSPATVERIRNSCVDPIAKRCVVPADGAKGFFVEI